MSVLVDSNVILDIVTNDPNWFNWSATKLAEYSERDALVINPIIYAEVSIGFEQVGVLTITAAIGVNLCSSYRNQSRAIAFLHSYLLPC